MSALLRMLDANANRAREALRVLEDIARFALDSQPLAADLKHLRHNLRAALDPIDPGLRLAWRDTEHDVGTMTEAPREYQRTGTHDIAAASAARLTEALRVIEECSKALAAPDAARRIEALRYNAYTIEQRLTLALGSRSRRQWRLCVLITESLCTLPWLDVARAALAAGADCVQLREKSLPDADLLARARQLRALTSAAGASLIINDRPDLALLAAADGVHLGPHDLPIPDARRIVGTTMLIGASTNNLEQAAAAHAAGADYCGVGPMFPTTTKDKPLAGPAFLREYLAAPGIRDIPHLAIGGITPANIHQLTAAGCRGIAVSTAVCRAPDPAAIVRALLNPPPAAGGGAAAVGGGGGFRSTPSSLPSVHP